MRKIACLLVLLLGIVTVPASASPITGELELESTLEKADEWDLKLNSKAVLDYREWYNDSRIDARVQVEFPGEDDDLAKLSLERLSLRHYTDSWDLSVGKQPISWGIARSEGPLNLFPENVWGITGRLPTGIRSFWTLAAVINDNEELVLAARQQGYHQGIRYSALAARQKDTTIIGVDGQIDVGIELYGEVAYQFGEENFWQYMLGGDYQLGPFVGVTEYRYEGNRETSHLFQSFSYSLDEFTSLALAVDQNLGDNSRLWTIGGESFITNDLKLAVSAIFPQGDDHTQYGMVKALQGTQIYTLGLSMMF